MAITIAVLVVIHLSRGFFRLSPTKLVEFSRNVVVLMTGNPNFPTPVPALSVLTAAIDKLDDLIQKALSGDRIMIAARDVARNELLMVLVDLGAYVQATCLNSLAVFITSGFQAIKPRSSSVVPPTPTVARLTQGHVSGSLVFQFKKSRNTQSCSIQIASSPTGPWTDYGVTSKSKVTLSGLPTMAVTWARVKANGAAGSSGWSEPTCKAVI
jgi:hypothetical protein